MSFLNGAFAIVDTEAAWRKPDWQRYIEAGTIIEIAEADNIEQ
jgi:hypothetical protein